MLKQKNIHTKILSGANAVIIDTVVEFADFNTVESQTVDWANTVEEDATKQEVLLFTSLQYVTD